MWIWGKLLQAIESYYELWVVDKEVRVWQKGKGMNATVEDGVV